MADKKIKFIVSTDSKQAVDGFNRVDSKINNISTSLKGLGSSLGLVFGGAAIIKFGLDFSKLSAQLEVLRGNFSGTIKDIKLFQKATAGTVTEANLIKLSNQATDLGISLKQQALLFSLAEDAGDKYTGSVEENFYKLVTASEGTTKGLKALGVQKEIYETILKRLAKAQGGIIDNLDAETQKQIRLQAIIEASGITINDVTNKIQDNADKLESWSVLWEKTGTKIGDFVLPGLLGVVRVLENLYGWLEKIGSLPKGLLSLTGINISDEALGLISTPKYGGDKTGIPPVGSMERIVYDIQQAKKKAGKGIKIVGEVQLIINKIKELVEASKDVNITFKQYYENLSKIEELQKKLIPPTVGKVARLNDEMEKLKLEFTTTESTLRQAKINERIEDITDELNIMADLGKPKTWATFRFEMRKMSDEFNNFEISINKANKELFSLQEKINRIIADRKKRGEVSILEKLFGEMKEMPMPKNKFGQELDPLRYMGAEKTIDDLKREWWGIEAVASGTADAIGQTWMEMWRSVFGEADNLVTKLFNNIMSRLASLATEKLALTIFEAILLFINPSASAVAMAIAARGASSRGQRVGKISGDNTYVIQIGEQKLVTLVGNVLPQAYSEKVRYREIRSSF